MDKQLICYAFCVSSSASFHNAFVVLSYAVCSISSLLLHPHPLKQQKIAITNK
jgi:hypothetical protein